MNDFHSASDGVWHCHLVDINQLALGGRPVQVVGDLRLLNRSELMARFQLPLSSTDGDIVEAAYLHVGRDFPTLLRGEFSFALLDSHRHEVLLVRDVMGIRPLYYAFQGGCLITSNSLDHMRAHSDLTHDLCDEVLAEWCLSGSVHNQHRTFYAAIQKCPRATVLHFSRAGLEAHTYWQHQDVVPLHYRDERDYVHHLQELIQSAVRERYQNGVSQGAHLSGGLDSTPIAVMAGRVAIAQGLPFHTYNWCKPDDRDQKELHEWSDARQVAQSEQFTHHEIGAYAASLKSDLLHHNVAHDGSTMFVYERDVLAAAQSAGVRQIFSGFGGDELLTTRGRDLHVDAIRSGRWGELWQKLRNESAPAQRWSGLRMGASFVRGLEASFAPTQWRHRAYNKMQRLKGAEASKLYSADFMRHAEQFVPPHTHAPRLGIRSDQWWHLTSGYHQERVESWAILGQRQGVRYAYPFLDERLVAFALAVPPHLFYQRGTSRYLYRQALTDVLSPQLLRKAKPAENYRVRQLLRERIKALSDPDVLDCIAAIQSPYVNTSALVQACQQSGSINMGQMGEAVASLQAMTNAVMALHVMHPSSFPARPVSTDHSVGHPEASR